MDLLFSRYASPFEFMKPYISCGRFGELVNNIVMQETNRRKAEADMREEDKLWTAYVHSCYEGSFLDWKSEVLKPAGTGKKDDDITDADIEDILKDLFPEQMTGANE